jgi:hypothetical protein
MIVNPDRLVGRGGSPLYQAIKCQFIGAQLYVVAVLHVRCENPPPTVHRLSGYPLLFLVIVVVLLTILPDLAMPIAARRQCLSCTEILDGCGARLDSLRSFGLQGTPVYAVDVRSDGIGTFPSAPD